MKIVMSYFEKYEDGTAVWLATGKEPTGKAVEIQERPVLVPDDGKVLKNKKTGETSAATWLKDTMQDDWEEIKPETERGE